jgi:hypothetical protein
MKRGKQRRVLSLGVLLPWFSQDVIRLYQELYATTRGGFLIECCQTNTLSTSSMLPGFTQPTHVPAQAIAYTIVLLGSQRIRNPDTNQWLDDGKLVQKPGTEEFVSEPMIHPRDLRQQPFVSLLHEDVHRPPSPVRRLTRSFVADLMDREALLFAVLQRAREDVKIMRQSLTGKGFST